MRRYGLLALVLGLLLLAGAPTGHAQDYSVFNPAKAVGHSHTSAATITLTPVSNQFVYITGLDISNCQGAAAVTAAAPTYITTTGITGAPQFQVGSGPAVAGTCTPGSFVSFDTPLKSATVGTAVTVVLPTFITNQVVSVNVYYFLGF